MSNVFVLTNSIVIPWSWTKKIVLHICRRIAMNMCPVRDAVMRGVHARHHTHAGRCANRCCVSVCKFHSVSCETLHIRGMIPTIELRLLGPKWKGSVLPSHVIYEEYDNIRTLLCLNPESKESDKEYQTRSFHQKYVTVVDDVALLSFQKFKCRRYCKNHVGSDFRWSTYSISTRKRPWRSVAFE